MRARHETDARSAGELAVGFGHVGGRALVPCADDCNLGRIVKRVQHRLS
jgi:hypothetical protein